MNGARLRPSRSAASQSRGRYWYFSESRYSSLPGRTEEFRTGVLKALDYAGELGNTRVHVMAGLLPAQADQAARLDLYQTNVAWAAQQAAARGITIVLEPINQRDMPGYLLSYQQDALAIIDAIGASNLQVQFDCYHCQITEGDIAMKLRAMFELIGHVQIASVPSRNEPDGQELSYPYIFQVLDELGYAGWVGCEYKPRAGTSAGLGWLHAYRRQA